MARLRMLTQIIKLTLQMPKCTLTDEQCDELATEINKLQTKNIEELKEKVPELTNNTIKYISAWFNTGHALADFIREIETIWRNNFKTNLSVDDILPILIELLPADSGLLETLQTKLTDAFRIQANDVLTVSFTNLYAAVFFKLQMQSEDKIEADPDTQTVVDELVLLDKKCEQVNSLKNLCLDYQNLLFLLLSTRIKNELPIDEINAESLHTLNAELNFTDISTDLNFLYTRFSLVDEMLYTLTRTDINMSRRLTEFCGKYDEYLLSLTDEIDYLHHTMSSFKQFNFIQGYQWMSLNWKEKEFINAGSQPGLRKL